jgi:hypothetical protein
MNLSPPKVHESAMHMRAQVRPREERWKSGSKVVNETEGSTYSIKSAPIVCCATSSASSGSAPALVMPARTSSRASAVPTALRSVLASAGGLFDVTICCRRLSSISAGVGAGCVPAAAMGGTGRAPTAAEGASAVCEPEGATAVAAAGVGVTDAGGVGKLSDAMV